jgi:hypothetical protein
MDNSKRKKPDKAALDRLDKAMKKSEKELFELNTRLCYLVAEFGVRALKTFQAAKSEPLNPLQINEIVTKEILAVIEWLQMPDNADSVIRKAEADFYNLTEKEDRKG